MLLATILLLFPFPQTGDAGKVVTDASAAVSTDATKDSSLSQPMPSMPEAKVKTDVEVADASSPSHATAEAVQPPVRPMSLAPVRSAATRPYETPTQRKVWYALAVTGHGAAVFDAWSTRRVISQGYGTEGNPLLRPFSHSGAMYAATQVSPLVMDYLGKRMMLSQHNWVRRMWWLPQSAGSGFSLAAGVHNSRLVP